MVLYACNLNIQDAETEDQESEASIRHGKLEVKLATTKTLSTRQKTKYT